jgi:hypothetical protein
MIKRDNKQNSILHSLISRLGWSADDKAETVLQYTAQRTRHSSKMSYIECAEMISALESLTRADDEAKNKKRRRVISHLREAGYTKDGKADMPGIYTWCRTQKHKKPLNNLTSHQLSELIHAAEKVKAHYLKQVSK